MIICRFLSIFFVFSKLLTLKANKYFTFTNTVAGLPLLKLKPFKRRRTKKHPPQNCIFFLWKRTSSHLQSVPPDDVWSILGQGGGLTQAHHVAQLQIIMAMSSFNQSISVAVHRDGQSSKLYTAHGCYYYSWLPARSP